jgi:hypothetical protein
MEWTTQNKNGGTELHILGIGQVDSACYHVCAAASGPRSDARGRQLVVLPSRGKGSAQLNGMAAGGRVAASR